LTQGGGIIGFSIILAKANVAGTQIKAIMTTKPTIAEIRKKVRFNPNFSTMTDKLHKCCFALA
jgi:hypothetical protein